ncbi:transposase [Burkholderia sp. Ac-20379]|nr:transposase [Burkholderia sp. Ac-20379]
MNEAMPTLDDALWSMIQPLIPPAKARRTRYPGRKPLGDRAVMAGILYVLETGIPWGQLPQEMGFGSGMSCWRRLRDWQQAGVWTQIHAVLMGQMRSAARVDWSRVQIESRPKRAAAAEVRAAVIAAAAAGARAEERRGGEECWWQWRCRGWAGGEKKNDADAVRLHTRGCIEL